MTIKSKINQEDLILYEILRNPVLCGEFINNIDKTDWEEPFEFTWYQKEQLCDFNNYVVLCTARATGKTVSLTNLILWVLINNIFPTDYIVYHVPGRSHLEPVFSNLIRLLKSNSFLKHFTDTKSGINQSDFTIRLLNGSVLLCRIAGQTGTGAPVVGLHTPFTLFDELGYYPWGTWIEAQPTLNTFTSGFRLVGAGVPTGVREKNVLYTLDQENSSYTKHRVSALQNPRFTDKNNDEAIEMYGGDDSDDYIHLVLGQHGKPVFSLFDRNSMLIESYPVYQLVLDGTILQNNLTEYYAKLSSGLVGLPNKNSQAIFGIDLGFTEPTAINIMYLDSLGHMRFHARVRLNKVNYFIQEKIIDFLDTKFDPIIIGIDEGSAGKSVIPRLMDYEDFIHKNYKSRIIPINFSSWISLGTDSDGKEIKNKTKPFAVGLLQDYTVNHKIIYSSTDPEMIVELERMTYSKTPAGDIVYKTLTDRGGKRGEDHFTSALLCASLAYYIKLENVDLRPKIRKLYSPRWFIGV